ENGSKYLLPLSVDGLVLVASISLVELTGQISAVETAVRTAAAAPPDAPVAPLAADVVLAGALPPAVVAGQRIPGRESAVEPGRGINAATVAALADPVTSG